MNLTNWQIRYFLEVTRSHRGVEWGTSPQHERHKRPQETRHSLQVIPTFAATCNFQGRDNPVGKRERPNWQCSRLNSRYQRILRNRSILLLLPLLPLLLSFSCLHFSNDLGWSKSLLLDNPYQMCIPHVNCLTE